MNIIRIALCLMLVASHNARSANQLAPPDATVMVCASDSGALSVSKAELEGQRCRSMTVAEVGRDFPQIGRAANALALGKSYKRFCSQAGASCDDINDPSADAGTFMGARFQVSESGASIEGTPGGKVDDTSQAWWVDCNRDKMTGTRSCAIHRGDLWIFVSGGRTFVSVGDEHFPGSQTSLRIGNARFDTMHRDGNFSQPGILPALQNGRTVVTRYMRWPERSYVDNEFVVLGAQTAIAIARWLLKHGEIK